MDGTIWDRSQYRTARGNLTAQEWQLVKGGLIETVSISPFYRIRRASTGGGKAFFLDPTPSRIEQLVFEYVTQHWVLSADGAATKEYLIEDDDVALFDSELIFLGTVWQFKESRGLPFAADIAKYEDRRDRLFGQDTGERVLKVGRQGRRDDYFQVNLPETGFGGVTR